MPFDVFVSLYRKLKYFMLRPLYLICIFSPNQNAYSISECAKSERHGKSIATTLTISATRSPWFYWQNVSIIAVCNFPPPGRGAGALVTPPVRYEAFIHSARKGIKQLSSIQHNVIHRICLGAFVILARTADIKLWRIHVNTHTLTFTETHTRAHSHTHTNIHKHSQTFTNIHKQSQTFTNIHTYRHTHSYTIVKNMCDLYGVGSAS
jgi:hypothetical protein